MSLVLDLELREGSGTTLADSSGFGNNATLVGSPSWVTTGMQGNGIQFNADTDYINAGNASSLRITGDITIVAWIKLNNLTTYSYIAAKNLNTTTSNYLFRVTQTTGLLRFARGNGVSESGVDSTNSITPGVQHQVAVSVRGTLVTFYIDGVASGTGNITSPVVDTGDNLTLGAIISNGNSFNGTMSKIRIYNNSLSASEISTLFQQDQRPYSYEQIRKRYYYKVYDTQQRYVKTWEQDVISDPTFREVINGGAGQLMVNLGRRYDNFGEGVDVALQNRVELWCADADNLANNAVSSTLWDTAKWDVDLWDSSLKSFIKLFSGFISAYSPILDDEEQYVQVTVLGYVVEASYRTLKDSSGNTTITYTNQDPGTIMTDIIDKYRADGGTNISYLGSSIQSTGFPVTYTFTNNTLADCFNKLVALSPDGWFWYIDPNGVMYFQSSSMSVADHNVTIGKDIAYLQTNKRIENLVNRVFVVGGGSPNLFNRYDRATSQSTYGIFERTIQDGKVTDNTTADYLAKRELDLNDSPETRTVLRIIDNNGENTNLGANIESFSVGDTIQIKNLNYGSRGTTVWDNAIWDTDVWDSTIQYSTASILTIVSLEYNPDYITIEAASRLPEITKRIEDINTNLITQSQIDLPSTPTTRSV